MARPGAGASRQEQRTVLTTRTCMASHNSEEEEATQCVPPTPRSGRIYFVRPAAVRTGLQSNLSHRIPSLGEYFLSRRARGKYGNVRIASNRNSLADPRGGCT